MILVVHPNEQQAQVLAHLVRQRVRKLKRIHPALRLMQLNGPEADIRVKWHTDERHIHAVVHLQ